MDDDQGARKAIMERLSPLLGAWRVEAFGVSGRSVFEWTLGGQFLMQSTTIEHPDAPNSTSIMGVGRAGGEYTQHYFDTRGVARLYEMTFDDGVWILLRESADFSPLDFRQRYLGRLSDDGRTIDGAWEIDHGSGWEKDFDLTYTRE